MRYALTGAALLSLMNYHIAVADQRDTPSTARLPAEVTANLIDGRQITGRVAATTDDERLDLIVSSQRVAVTTHLTWQQVDSFHVKESQFSVGQFRQRIGDFLLSEPPAPQRQAELMPVIPSSPDAVHTKRASVPNTHLDDSRPAISLRRATRAIQMNARLANWDSDAAADGLLLELYVLDESGRTLRVPGHLTAKLVGLRQQITSENTAFSRQRPVADLESWSQLLRVADFTDGVAIVKLPFRHLVPERDLDIAAGTLLQVSYGVPSIGVFKASQPDVLIRWPSVFRDELFLSTGERVLPLKRGATPRRNSIRATFNR